MDESLGTLKFVFRAEKDAFRQDLLEMDRMAGEYRRKWETAVRMSAAGSPATSGVQGPHITGTSNGNVSWNLAEAVKETQRRTDSAFSIAKRMTSESWTMSGGAGGVDAEMLREARAAKRAAEREAREQRVQKALELDNKVAYSDFQRKQTEREAAAWGPIAKAEGRESNTPWWKKNFGHTAIRSIVGTMVVDALASELNNEENYRKAMRLAGNNQGAQASAVLDRARGAFGAVPLVGGMAFNATNALIGLSGGPTSQAIETSIALTAQQNQYQDTATQIRLGAIGSRLGSQALIAGNSFHGREIQSRIAKIGRDAGLRAMQSQLESQAGMEGYADGWGDLSNSETRFRSWIPFAGALARQGDVDSANDARRVRNDARRAGINNVLGVQREANRAMEAAEEQQRKYDAALTKGLQLSQITQGDYNAAYRYTAGASARVAIDYQEKVKDAKRRGMTRDDSDILWNEGIVARQGLEEMRRGVMENYRWGSGREYNPMIESPLGFTDRGVETVGDQMNSLVAAITDLNNTLKQLPVPGMP